MFLKQKRKLLPKTENIYLSSSVDKNNCCIFRVETQFSKFSCIVWTGP